ncbi:MAG: biopolymer transporter ExbD [Acidobacteria bacterium]|nr:biopolymer transporter ExbD [Acidobacteriota bacterium]
MSKPVINVTPLIDVLLVLLIIFMVVTPLKPSSIKTQIPYEPRNTSMIREDPRTLVVIIGNDKSLMLNSEKLDSSIESSEQLIARLKTVFSARAENSETERTIFIKAPPSLEYGNVVKVIDAVKIAGAHPVSLQIDNLK